VVSIADALSPPPNALPNQRIIGHQAAVDRYHRTGHIVGQVGRKEFDDLRAILDGSETP
jgi:hypothetical protein